MVDSFTSGSIAVMWLILLGVLLVIEIITLGLTTIWFAGGALAAFLAAWQAGFMAADHTVFGDLIGSAYLYQTRSNKVHEQKCLKNQC